MRRSEALNPSTSSAFLRRVQTTTLVLGGLGVLAVSTYVGLAAGVAALAGLLLSLANMKLLQEIFAHALAPEARRGIRILLGLVIKFPLLLGGTALALGPLHLPPIWFLAGFSLVLAVILLKVLGLLLLSTRGGSGRARLFVGFGLFALLLCVAPAARTGLSPVPLAVAQEAAPQASKASEGPSRAGEIVREGAEGTTAGHAEGTAAKEEENQAEPPELPSAFHILHLLFPGAAWAAFLYDWQNPIYGMLVIIFLCVLAVTAYRRRTMIPGKMQNGVEYVVESFSNFILGILGPRGKEFIPFLGTLFLYIWLNNLQGLVPFFKSPTSVYNTTLALAICVFGYVQYTGITKLGILGYLHHMMGSPRDVIGWCMVPLMLPLHLIEEVAKPVSLSLRLFGNILGEDVLLGIFATLGIALLSFMKSPVGVPLHLPFIFLSLLMSTIQALVFTLLATIYFSQMLPHEEEHGEHGHGGH